MDKDITDEVKFNFNDEYLPLNECACGEEFRPWNFVIGAERDYPKSCPKCGRKLYFTITVKVFEVGE